ncbi:MAG: hypothetical protein ACOCP8_07705 [archaeon]
MTRSKIIVDFLDGSNNLEDMLLRLKTILYDLDSKEIDNWINNELNGYKEEEDLPDYRYVNGALQGMILVGNYKYSNTQLPTHHLSDEIKNKLLNPPIYASIGKIHKLLEKGEILKRQLPLESCVLFSQGLARGKVASANLILGEGEFQEIISNIKNLVIDVLLELEGEFGNLDSLDIIREADLSEEEKAKLEKKIINFIFYDGSTIDIGNNNKINNNKF